MIVDSSAIVAVLRDEPDAAQFATALASEEAPRISAANWLEAAIVIGNDDPVASRRFDEFTSELALIVEPVTVEQAQIARTAYREFGRGSGHPAGLNFGDCFAYALAQTAGEPLLFKGDDFVYTDVADALRTQDSEATS